jgi:hypothetical protein
VTTTAIPGKTGRFPISFDFWYRVLSTLLVLPPSRAYVALTEEEVEVRMGWAFRSRFHRSAVASVSASNARPLCWGVHGFGGRWLVNGSRHGILEIQLSPVQRGYVLGVPVRLRELLVSVREPPILGAALRGSR